MCLLAGDTVPKGALIPNVSVSGHPEIDKLLGREEQPAFYQLVGGVTAYQGYDG